MANVNIPIKDRHDENNDLFYPNTKTDAVYDNDGNSLETRLADIISESQWEEILTLLGGETNG